MELNLLLTISSLQQQRGFKEKINKYIHPLIAKTIAKSNFSKAYIVISITGSSDIASAESNAFSTSSLTVVYRHFPG